jgi:hypothetical protein
LGIGKTWHTEVFEKRFHNDISLWEATYNTQSKNNADFLHQWGKNFDADFQKIRLRVNLKPSPKLTISNEFDYLDISPDQNQQSTRLYLLTTNYNFTPNLWLRLIMQFNKSNDRGYVYGLFGWRFAPPFGVLYIAYTDDRFNDPLDVQSIEHQRTLFLKVAVPVSLM